MSCLGRMAELVDALEYQPTELEARVGSSPADL